MASKTYLEIDLSLVNPSDDHVGAGHAAVLGETKADIAERAHLQLERDVLRAGAERPQQAVIGRQHGRVWPARPLHAAAKQRARAQHW